MAKLFEVRDELVLELESAVVSAHCDPPGLRHSWMIQHAPS
jgi:hypothetical protein